jgi:hypothetical protein
MCMGYVYSLSFQVELTCFRRSHSIIVDRQKLFACPYFQSSMWSQTDDKLTLSVPTERTLEAFVYALKLLLEPNNYKFHPGDITTGNVFCMAAAGRMLGVDEISFASESFIVQSLCHATFIRAVQHAIRYNLQDMLVACYRFLKTCMSKTSLVSTLFDPIGALSIVDTKILSKEGSLDNHVVFNENTRTLSLGKHSKINKDIYHVNVDIFAQFLESERRNKLVYYRNGINSLGLIAHIYIYI